MLGLKVFGKLDSEGCAERTAGGSGPGPHVARVPELRVRGGGVTRQSRRVGDARSRSHVSEPRQGATPELWVGSRSCARALGRGRALIREGFVSQGRPRSCRPTAARVHSAPTRWGSSSFRNRCFAPRRGAQLASGDRPSPQPGPEPLTPGDAGPQMSPYVTALAAAPWQKHHLHVM